MAQKDRGPVSVDLTSWYAPLTLVGSLPLIVLAIAGALFASRPAPARATVGDDGTVELRWTDPQRRVAAGQSVVLYRDLPTTQGALEVVVGGGIVSPRP